MIETREHVFLDPSAEPWADFAASHPHANIFHHPAWTALLSDCYGFRPFVVAVRDSNDIVCAGLPMMETGSRLARRRWKSLPFTDHCAPLHDSSEAGKRLARSLAGLSMDQRTPDIELRCEFPGEPSFWSHSDHVLHTVPLCPDSEAVFRNFVPMHRRNIKVAEKKGVRIVRGTERRDLDVFYRLHLETRRRQGMPVQPRRFFDLLGSDVIEKGLGFVLLAYKDDECLAAAVFLHWQHTLTYKYGASSLDGLSLRPNNLLFWSAIRWGCENGYTTFDMGRTDLANTGLRAFKSGWGAQEAPLAYSSLSPDRPRSMTGHMMPIAQAVVRNSPLWVCRASGELLYKHFG